MTRNDSCRARQGHRDVGGIFPMVTFMKLTHEGVPFKHSVVRLHIAALC